MKQKSHKGLTKRVKVGKKGKVKAKPGGSQHLKSNKTAKRRRQIRKTAVLGGATGAKIREAVGN